MTPFTIQESSLRDFALHLRNEERSPGTIDNYLRHLRVFVDWLAGRAVDKSVVGEWKQHLLHQHYAATTINAMLAALHSYFRFRGWNDCRVRYLRMQRRLFRADDRALQESEYRSLLRTARARGESKWALVIETLAGTGIRVSELSAITVEAAKAGRADIHLKGKIRTILLAEKLCRKLLTYARAQKIARGEIFLTASGKTLSRFRIWAAMKRLARQSGVAPSKVFPHNLRHLFAVTFYNQHHDLARLADLLGHSSIETTRIYLITPSSVCRQQLEAMPLVE